MKIVHYFVIHIAAKAVTIYCIGNYIHVLHLGDDFCIVLFTILDNILLSFGVSDFSVTCVGTDKLLQLYKWPKLNTGNECQSRDALLRT